MCRPPSATGASRSFCRTRPSVRQTCRAAPSPSASQQPWPTFTSARSYSAGGAGLQDPFSPLAACIRSLMRDLESGCMEIVQLLCSRTDRTEDLADLCGMVFFLSPPCQQPSCQPAFRAEGEEIVAFSACRNGVGPRPILWPRVRAWARSVQQHYSSSELEALQLHNVMQEVCFTRQDDRSGA